MTIILEGAEHQYETALRKIRTEGTFKSDRTNTGTVSLFGLQMRWDLAKGFPLTTSKKVFMRGLSEELFWFLRGETNIKSLVEKDVHIWDAWADADGELGPVYGYQWRSWPGKVIGLKNVNPVGRGVSDLHFNGEPIHESIDQITQVIETLRKNPDSRRIMVSAWNPAQVDQMKLPPCHCLFQFYSVEMTFKERYDYSMNTIEWSDFLDFGTEITEDMLNDQNIPKRKLSCQLYQRSADFFLGVPFNIASYALLTHIIAQQVNMAVGEFIWTGGDCHIYSDHLEVVDEQLSLPVYPFPTLELTPADDIFSYTYENIKLHNYVHGPVLKGTVAV